MKFEKTQVFNFEGAFRGLRNPLESWWKSDSFFGIIDPAYDEKVDEIAELWVDQELNRTELQEGEEPIEKYDSRWCDLEDAYIDWILKNQNLTPNNSIYFDEPFEAIYLGPNDLGLAQKMVNGGPSHRKFLRQIIVSVDIAAPLYWWKEFDTYKVGTVANSTSTMHKLASTPITKECFEINDFDERLDMIDDQHLGVRVSQWIDDLEQLRQKYMQTGNKAYWKELIRWLPEG